MILCRLLSHADRVRFGSVCRQWRLAAQRQRRPLHPALPWLSMSDGQRQLPKPPGRRTAPPTALTFRALHWHFRQLAPVPSVVRYSPEPCLFLMNPLSKATEILPDRCYEPAHYTPVDYNVGKIIVCSSDLVAAAINFPGVYNRIAFCRPGASSWYMSPPDDQWRLLEIILSFSSFVYLLSFLFSRFSKQATFFSLLCFSVSRN